LLRKAHIKIPHLPDLAWELEAGLSAGVPLSARVRAVVLCVEDDNLQIRFGSRPEKQVNAHIMCRRKRPCQRKAQNPSFALPHPYSIHVRSGRSLAAGLSHRGHISSPSWASLFLWLFRL